jgi:hypothetical protein
MTLEHPKPTINDKKNYRLRYLIISIIAWILTGLLIQTLEANSLLNGQASFLLWSVTGFILFSFVFLVISKRIKPLTVKLKLTLIATALLVVPTISFIRMMYLFVVSFLLYRSDFTYSISMEHNFYGYQDNYLVIQTPRYLVPIPTTSFIIATSLTALFIISTVFLAVRLRKKRIQPNS